LLFPENFILCLRLKLVGFNGPLKLLLQTVSNFCWSCRWIDLCSITVGVEQLENVATFSGYRTNEIKPFKADRNYLLVLYKTVL